MSNYIFLINSQIEVSMYLPIGGHLYGRSDTHVALLFFILLIY